MRFLETITFAENDILVAVDRIKYIILTYNDAWRLKIVTDDHEWEESFGKDEAKARVRYQMVKNIVQGA